MPPFCCSSNRRRFWQFCIHLTFFQQYLIERFGHRLYNALLAVDVKQLAAIRNGDWAKFKRRYHDYLIAASAVCWIAFHPHAHDLLMDEQIVDQLLQEISNLPFKILICQLWVMQLMSFCVLR